jgi:N-acetylglucosamine-6-phosphate deacetylase
MVKQIFARKVFNGFEVVENQLLSSVEGKITAIESSKPGPDVKIVDCLAPGFFDIHINGGATHHFTQKPDQETILDIREAGLATGVAYTLPTLITSSTDNILQGIEAIRRFWLQHPDSGVLGMHLEGPFLNPVRRGAHLLEHVRKPSYTELREIIDHGSGVIRLITVAPEEFTRDQLGLLMEAGMVVSAGHSNATYQQAKSAFDQGVRLVTHLYNAMSGFGHREPGLVGATFDTDSVYAPIILDGVHCDFAAARIAYQQKKDKLFLISDALFLGQNVERFQWGEFDAVLSDGRYTNSEGNLAGGAVSLADTVRNAVYEVGISLQEAIEMATIRPAMALGVDKKIGRVDIGYPAVFTAFSNNLSTFAVEYL